MIEPVELNSSAWDYAGNEAGDTSVPTVTLSTQGWDTASTSGKQNYPPGQAASQRSALILTAMNRRVWVLSGVAVASLMIMDFQHCYQSLIIVTPFLFVGT